MKEALAKEAVASAPHHIPSHRSQRGSRRRYWHVIVVRKWQVRSPSIDREGLPAAAIIAISFSAARFYEESTNVHRDSHRNRLWFKGRAPSPSASLLFVDILVR